MQQFETRTPLESVPRKRARDSQGLGMSGLPDSELHALTKRLVDIVYRELPWVTETQAKRVAYRTQDMAEAALAVLCSEPDQELTEKEQETFVCMTADTQLMMAITQVKEWGLDIEPVDFSILTSASSQEASREALTEMMQLAGFILWSLERLDVAAETNLRKVGGEDWKQETQVKLNVSSEFIQKLHAYLIAHGKDDKQATKFILDGFGCGLGGIALGSESSES